MEPVRLLTINRVREVTIDAFPDDIHCHALTYDRFRRRGCQALTPSPERGDVVDELPGCWGVGDPKEPGAGMEGKYTLREILRDRQDNFVESVEIDDDVEMRAHRQQIGEREQLLRLFVAE